MKNRGSLLSLKPEREDFNGWKVSMVERKGKEVKLVGKGPNAQYQAHHKLQSKASSYPCPASLGSVILDGQQPCPAYFIAPPTHRQALPYSIAFPSFPTRISMAPSFATRASSVAPCLFHAYGHGGVSLMLSLLVASSVPAVRHQLAQCSCGKIQPTCENWQ